MLFVYVDQDALELLGNLEAEDSNREKLDLTVEFIDSAPLTAIIKYDGNKAEISIFVRDEMHTNNKLEMYGVFDGVSLNVDKGEDEETVAVAFAVAEGINQFLIDNKLMEKYATLDEGTQGVYFKADKNNIVSKVVEGKARPNLLCTSLFGAPKMARPYGDELVSQFMMSSLTSEQIEEDAKAGDPDAQEQLAMAYLNGTDGCDEDPQKAFYWFEKSAEAGNVEAMFNVGLSIAKGFGTDRDFAKAAEWMQKASEAGDWDAEACAKEYKKLAEAVDKAKAGDAQAQADLASGLMKLGGSLEQAGEGKDYQESVMWAEKAVEQNNADGYWTLALAYHHGRGVDVDMNKAIELYSQGAELGSASCQHNLGCEYLSGNNIKADAHKGFELIKKAAEQGYGLAMRDLGKCYQFAKGTPGNMKTAIEWYEKALEVIDDPELEQKTNLFKMLADSDPSFSEDYPEDIERTKLTADTVIKVESNDSVSMFFNGKNFVISGFDSFTEKPIKKVIEDNHGVVRSSTVLDTDYLIYDERFGFETKKYNRAIELNEKKGKDIKIIPLAKFLEMAENSDFSEYVDIKNDNDDITHSFGEEKDSSDTAQEKSDKYMTKYVPEAITNAWQYEDELEKSGYLPNEVHGELAWEHLTRVTKKASEGDKKAIQLLKDLDNYIHLSNRSEY